MVGTAGQVAARLATSGARRAFLAAISRIAVGTLTLTLPEGGTRTYRGKEPGQSAELAVQDDAFFAKVIFHGEIGFGEAYQAGLCTTPDLVALIELAIANRRKVNLNQGPLRQVSRIANRRLHLGRRNTVAQAKDNIHAHYDIGNDFFRLWLDETMTYSCALFTSEEQSLADAQRDKYRALCALAGIEPGARVLEIGTGWGGFAMLAASEFGAHVTTVTISEEQHALASERVAKANLTDKVDVRLSDYRDVEGSFDAIVSIEMFEAVGAEYFQAFFDKCGALLRPGGRLAMQVITVPDREFPAQRDGVNWIQKYIFPGGVLPSVAEMERSNGTSELILTSVRDIGSHYVQTLHEWRDRFWAAIDDVRAQGYDEHFVRTWDYYLAVCEAGFATRTTGDVHILFEKPGTPENGGGL